ncbi:MAG: DUF4838 domain-containing protein [Spirochaetaceae bacterium]|nr:MAG: DUF4838 domain-containing protein [Spirochaetaceae bacterium]
MDQPSPWGLIKMRIIVVGRTRTIQFAATELGRYLETITGDEAVIEHTLRFDPDDAGIAIGLANAFPHVALPEVTDSRFDDAIGIRVDDGVGLICGNNERSVLLAVYRYLTEIGCRWFRPGTDGELLPGAEAVTAAVEISETPSYRHRGICIEGAVSYENVRDTIDWLPKVGMNSYFIQFREAYTFFERWYAHRDNPLADRGAFSVDEARACVERAVDEIDRRGLLYHAVGHGWTTEPFGIKGLSWDQRVHEVDPTVREYLAQIGGERKIFDGIPLNTNLCYSNEEARRIMVEEIAEYAAAHPRIDVMHVWLADGSNNQCECENCRRSRPADFYVMLLNEIDELLSRRGLETKIVFLIYVDLLWPPERERIANPDRFILMFAPITRTYREPFTTDAEIPDLPAYRRNELVFPRDVAANLAFLRAWQSRFSGDSFVFDYHFMWAHVKDPGYTKIAQVLHEDICNLKRLKLDGYISCQVQRSFLPHGLGLAALGSALWDSESSFEQCADDYFRSAFGHDGPLCAEFYRALSERVLPLDLESPSAKTIGAHAEALSAALDDIAEFERVIDRNLSSSSPVHAASWKHAKLHATIWRRLIDILQKVCDRETIGTTAISAAWDELATWMWQHEQECRNVFDVHNAVKVLGGTIRTLVNGGER